MYVIENDIKGNEETSGQQLLLFITGGAGSGKSFVLKLIDEHVKRYYTSLTGVATRQIHGKTLHSIFSLPIEKVILNPINECWVKDLSRRDGSGLHKVANH